MNPTKEQLQKEIWDCLSFEEQNNTGTVGGRNPIWLNLDEGWCTRWLNSKMKWQEAINIDQWDPSDPKDVVELSIIDWDFDKRNEDMYNPIVCETVCGKDLLEAFLLLVRKVQTKETK